MWNGSSGYGNGASCAVTDGTLARDVTQPWLVSACAGTAGRI